ncbi:TPA: hypothetical protein ACNVDX_003658 [Citrobacter gillenii]
MIIYKLVVLSLREEWCLLRTSKKITPFLADYRILQNEAHRLLKTLEKKA